MAKILLKTHKISFSEDNLEFKWYAIVTMFNHERKVAEMLKLRFENLGAADKFEEVFVPIEEWTEDVLGKIKKDGTRTKRTVKKSQNVLESGYIFIKMCMTDTTWNIVRQTTGVSGWLKMDGRPQPVPAEDVMKWKNVVGLGKEAREANINIVLGDSVRIIDGPFKDYIAKVVEIQDANVSVEVNELNGAKLEISALQLEVI